jgi:Zn-dependent protease
MWRCARAKQRGERVFEIMAIAVLGLFYMLIRPALDSSRWKLALDLSPMGLLWAVVGCAVLFQFFKPHVVPALIIAIMLHEYGHVLGYRLVGHSSPVFRLAPFGGVALSREPFRSEAESAFVSLMGPGFSVALLAVAAFLAKMLESTAPFASDYLFSLLTLAGVLNLFNMLPLFPLDGGRAAVSIASLGGRQAMFAVSILSSLAMAAFAAITGLLVIGVFALIGLLSAFGEQEARKRGGPRRMTPGEAGLTFVVYAAVTAAHAVAAAPFLQRFMPG